MITFEMIGKLSIGKESEKFHPYEEKKFNSGWQNRTLKFNVTSGDNSFLHQIKGGCFEDGHGDVYVTSASYTDENGKRQKGENFTIPFKDRLKSPRLAEVAEFKKFIIDVEKPNHRRDLERLIENVKDGHEVTEEEFVRFGAKDLKGLEEALEKSNKKRKEFISEWDYAEFIYKLIDSGKFNDKKFKVTGIYDMQYSEENGRWYNNYVPQRIYLADDSAEEMAEATVDLFYDGESLDDASILDTGKYYINGNVFVYDRNRKENIPAPYTVVIPVAKDDSEKEKKRESIHVRRFTVDDDKVYEYKIVVKLLNGAQRTEITEDDLTDEQKDSIMLGELTLDDIRRELGQVYGERVTENVYEKPARGFSKGRQETVYTSEDLSIKPLENGNAFEEADSESEDFDLFDDDDLL